MAIRHRVDEGEAPSVGDDDVVAAAAVDVAALPEQRQQRRIDDQLLVAVGVVRVQAFARAKLEFAVKVGGDMVDVALAGLAQGEVVTIPALAESED